MPMVQEANSPKPLIKEFLDGEHELADRPDNRWFAGEVIGSDPDSYARWLHWVIHSKTKAVHAKDFLKTHPERAAHDFTRSD